MLQLLESGAHPRQVAAGWTAASTVMHASVICLAIMASAQGVIARLDPQPVEDIVFAVVPDPVAPSAPAGRAPSAVPAIRPPIDLSRVQLPQFGVTVPVDLPNPLALLPGPALPVGGISDSGGAPVLPGRPGRVFDVRAVDRAVVPLAENRAPDYPAMLRSAAVEGEVLARFIVNADGRVERSSIAIVRSTHTLFAESVRRWLPATRYAPAEYGGAKVRQLVEQRIEFRLARE